MEVVSQDGSGMPVMVTGVSDTTLTLDANHPLAGMDLTFDIRLVEIVVQPGKWTDLFACPTIADEKDTRN